MLAWGLAEDAGWAQTAALAGPTKAAQRVVPAAEMNWKALTKAQLGILEKLNRADTNHLPRLPFLVAPLLSPEGGWPEDELGLSPLPPLVEGAGKLLKVDLALQAFGAYENGKLVRWGPVSSGSKKVPTPAGSYRLTWRAKRHVSTDDASWVLKWYFNFHNQSGRAFHAYPLPGYPASHSCIRLLARDAEWLYHWGESWKLSGDGREVLEPGTPVVFEGAYDFTATPPWRKL